MKLSLPKKFKMDTLLMVFTRFCGLTLQFGVTYILLRVMELEDYGNFIFFTALLNVTGVVISSAMMQITTRSVATNLQNNRFCQWSNRTVTFVIFLNLFCAFFYFLFYRSSSDYAILLPLAISSTILLISGIFQGYNNGQHQVLLSQTQEQILRPVLFLALVYVAYFYVGLSLSSVLAYYVVALLLALLVSNIIGRRFLKLVYPKISFNMSYRDFGNKFDKTLAVFMAAAFATNLLLELNVMVMKYFGHLEGIAVYSVILKIVNVTLIANTVIVKIIAPHIAKLYSDGELDELRKQIKSSTRISLVLSSMIAVVSFYFSEDLLKILLGIQITEQVRLAFSLLLVVQIFNIACGPVLVILIMTGNEIASLFALIISLIVSFIISILLVPELNLLGAVVSFSCGIILWNVFSIISVKSKLGFQPTAF